MSDDVDDDDGEKNKDDDRPPFHFPFLLLLLLLIPLTKGSDAEVSCFILSAPEQTIEWTIETPVIWDAIEVIMTSL